MLFDNVYKMENKYKETCVFFPAVCTRMSTQNGLVNGSNMCYRNSVVQCLIALPAIRKHLSTTSKEHDDGLCRMLRIIVALFDQQSDAVDIERNELFHDIPTDILRRNSRYEQMDVMEYFIDALGNKQGKIISDMFKIDMFEVDVYGTQNGPYKINRQITDTQHILVLANDKITAQHFSKESVVMLDNNTQQTTYIFPMNNPMLLCLQIDNPQNEMRITETIIVQHVRRPEQGMLRGVIQYDLHGAIFRNDADPERGGHFVACTWTPEGWMCHVSPRALHFPCVVKLCTLITRICSDFFIFTQNDSILRTNKLEEMDTGLVTFDDTIHYMCTALFCQGSVVEEV